MSRKDFSKGMEAGARPFEEKFRKQSEEFKKTAKDINKKLDDIDDVTDNIIDDLNSIQKKSLYGLNTLVDIVELGKDEKELLLAILYTLANMTDYVTEYQQTFLRSVKNYLKVANVQTSVDLSSIENIENINDQKAILQTVMEFLFLENTDHGYMEEYEDVLEYFSVNKKGIREIQECIDRIYTATGLQGIAENYGYVTLEEAENRAEDSYEAYDGSDICEACADTVNINTYVVLNDYLVYIDDAAEKLYRVSKKDGEKTLIDPKLGTGSAYSLINLEFFGHGENLFLLYYDNKDFIVKININNLQTSIIKLVGQDRRDYQCNDDFFIYAASLEDTYRIIKIDLESNKSEILEHAVDGQNVLTCQGCYLIGNEVFFRGKEIKAANGHSIPEENMLDSDKIYKFNLEEDTFESVCEISSNFYNFLSTGFFTSASSNAKTTGHYKNVLFSVSEGNIINNLGYLYLDIENPKALRNTNIMNYTQDTYSFIAYENIIYVTLNYKMPINKYNIVTGEDSVILESTQCADSYTTGVFKKETHYSLFRNAPKVVGRWIYYLGRSSHHVRKASIDIEMGESEELLIDGKTIYRF